MISKKYLKDYRLEEQIDSNGRVKAKAVYIGGDYKLSPELSKSEKRVLLALSALSTLLIIGALIPVSQATRTTYVIMPFTFSILPVFIMIVTTLQLYRAKEVMRREQAERTAFRLPACTFTTMLLTAAAFLGQVITNVFSRDNIAIGDISFSVLSLTIVIINAIAFSKCRKMKATEHKIKSRPAC